MGVSHPNHGVASTEVRALRLYIPSTPLSARFWGWRCFVSREERQLRSPWKHEEKSRGKVADPKAWELRAQQEPGGLAGPRTSWAKAGKAPQPLRSAVQKRRAAGGGRLLFFVILSLVVTPNTLWCFPSPGMEEGS